MNMHWHAKPSSYYIIWCCGTTEKHIFLSLNYSCISLDIYTPTHFPLTHTHIHTHTHTHSHTHTLPPHTRIHTYTRVHVLYAHPCSNNSPQARSHTLTYTQSTHQPTLLLLVTRTPAEPPWLQTTPRNSLIPSTHSNTTNHSSSTHPHTVSQYTCTMYSNIIIYNVVDKFGVVLCTMLLEWVSLAVFCRLNCEYCCSIWQLQHSAKLALCSANNYVYTHCICILHRMK